MYKVILEALDGHIITPRTGKSKVVGITRRLPNEMTYEEDKLMIIYDENEKCESQGVRMEVHGLEQLGNEYKFFDFEGRQFKITKITEDISA